MTTIEDIIEDLRSKKCRITKLRRALLEILSKDKMPVSVTELRIALLEAGIKVHKTSVYRELVVLKEQEIIREIQLGENKKRYELESLDHHHHIICIDCDKVEDIVLEKDLDIHEQKIMRQKKFKIISHSLEFFGLCAKCNN